MMLVPIELVPLLLLGPVLIATGYCDLRYMRIPNALSLVALALFTLSALVFLAADAVVMRIAIAVGVLAAGFAMFLFGMIGGGDVKILSALLLFVPTETVSLFMLVFSASMIFGMALMPVLRSMPGAVATGWASLQRHARFPMGISIALAGLVHPAFLVLLQVAG